MKDQSALKPTIFNIDAFIEKEEQSNGITDEERFLNSIADTNGWKIITAFKERVIKELEESNKAMMSGGLSFDEIGKNAVVINLAESIIDRILNKVNDAKEACEADTNAK